MATESELEQQIQNAGEDFIDELDRVNEADAAEALMRYAEALLEGAEHPDVHDTPDFELKADMANALEDYEYRGEVPHAGRLEAALRNAGTGERADEREAVMKLYAYARRWMGGGEAQVRCSYNRSSAGLEGALAREVDDLGGFDEVEVTGVGDDFVGCVIRSR